MDKWFLIYAKPMQDKRAEENLIRQGFNVFRPTITVTKGKIGCQNIVKQESLFPRYLFIKVDPEVTSITPVLSTFGVANFVRFGDKYAIASEELINEIQAEVEKQTTIAGSEENIKKGDQIFLDGHGFDRVKAIYCNPCGSMRAIILLNILGKESKLLVPLECISK